MRTGAKLAAVFAALLAAGAVGFAGCKGKGATGGCGALGTCGGNPVGEWVIVSPDDICNFPVTARPAQNYGNTAPYYAPETGVPAPAVTSGSWCWDLRFDKDGTLVSPEVPMPKPDVVVAGGKITFLDDADHTYIYELTAKSTTAFHVAKSCLGVDGANLTCPQLAMKIKDSTIGVNPVYTNETPDTTAPFMCHDQGDGCDCTFDYIETTANAVGDKGRWVVDGNVIHHYSISGQGNLFETNPSRRTVRDATFCVSDDGNTLELSGTNGQPLSLKTGLRSLKLTRVVPDAGTDAAEPVEASVEVGEEAPAPAADAQDEASTDATDDAADAGTDAADAGAADAADAG